MPDRNLLFAQVIEQLIELEVRVSELELIARNGDDDWRRIERSRRMIAQSRELLAKFGSDGTLAVPKS